MAAALRLPPMAADRPSQFPPTSHLLTMQSKFVRDQHALHRTDFFPGLGWMTNAGVWTSIREAW